MKKPTISILAHIPVAIIVGYISYFISANQMSNWYSIPLLFISAAIMKTVSDKIIGEKKDINFWFGNSGVIFLFVWFMSWIIFYNLLGV